ncbi:MAG: SAM-dependent methyltransferase [Deltaproteobacteria bacterium]|nr:SAM-dependent methyltransferase [Deltaproteobacteria bacterium]
MSQSMTQFSSAVGAEANRIARLFPSYRDFVDDALFHPAWGYYSTGRVRFGEGGHYDTFPIALSPYFGRMLARYAYRCWRRAGKPQRFEICELGAGNGQLCLDTLLAMSKPIRQTQEWQRFAGATRYRIVERSVALIERQRATLGPLAARVRWLRADLSRGRARQAPFAEHGLIIANEVLDCLAHHKIVPHPRGGVGVAFIVPHLGQRTVSRAELATTLSDATKRPLLSFAEVILPVAHLPHVESFIRRHYPELFGGRRKFAPYFACPEIGEIVRHSSDLYAHGEALWIDYGDLRDFHLRAGERQKVFAGPPRSGASIYRNPGGDDITFMVDFSVVESVAGDAGMRVAYFGGQRELARRSGVRVDAAAREAILKQRMLSWILSVVGVGPEQEWRRSGLTWDRRAGKGGHLRHDVRRAADEFNGMITTGFKLMILRRI